MLETQEATHASVAQALKTYIMQEFMYDRPGIELTGDLPLIGQGIIDSMGLFRLLAFLDERFDVIALPDEILLENFGTLDAIAAYVTTKLTN